MNNVNYINGNMKESGILTEKEKLAHQVLGETNARIEQDYIIGGKTRNELLASQAAEKHNQLVDEYTQRFEKYAAKVEEFAEKINKNAESIEIMPIGNYLLVKPFAENPFQRIVKSESGIILDMGGLAPTYKNTDNGEYEEEEQFIKVGVVQEVGPECKYCKPGDTIMYPKTREVLVPFYKLGYRIVNETGVIVTINEGLTERFENLKK